MVFYIDGEMQDRWSGQTDWEQASYEVAAGTHVFEWRYDKSPNGSAGEDCCWVDDITFPVNSIVLRVDSFTENKGLNVYPNPANDYIIVESDGIQEVEIYDMMGRKLISHKAETSSTIDVSALSSGIYLVRTIDSDNNITMQKIIKK